MIFTSVPQRRMPVPPSQARMSSTTSRSMLLLTMASLRRFPGTAARGRVEPLPVLRRIARNSPRRMQENGTGLVSQRRGARKNATCHRNRLESPAVSIVQLIVSRYLTRTRPPASTTHGATRFCHRLMYRYLQGKLLLPLNLECRTLQHLAWGMAPIAIQAR
jgi:hypothetical protein